MRRDAVLLAGAALASCVPNPRNEMPAVLAAAASALPAVSGSCVEREVKRLAMRDPVNRRGPALPARFTDMDAAQFRGGGGVKGASLAGLRIGHGGECYQLYGPVIAEDRALVRGISTGGSVIILLRRTDGVWRVVDS